jgi:DNA-binding protein HU-beta
MMNKAQIVQNLAKSIQISKAAAERTVNAFLTEIKKGVKKDKQVSIVGFGTFKVRNRKARMGRNPKTGAKIKIKASRTVGFKAGRPFKEVVC